MLVCLGAGVGNIVLATPLLVALQELGFRTDVVLAADYVQTSALLQPWSAVRRVFSQFSKMPSPAGYSHVAPALPPFYWPRFAQRFQTLNNLVHRPPDSAFYRDEQEFYLSFADKLGWVTRSRPCFSLPIAASEQQDVTAGTLVLAPGCKTGEMAAKRWPYFPELAAQFEDVALVGTPDDLRQADGKPFTFPGHVRSFVGQLTLRQTAELMAAAGAVVGNDSGLSHLAAATGVPTVMLFGPTPHATLGRFPANVNIIRRGLACEPCWFGSRLRACAGRVDCLREISVKRVVAELHELGLGGDQRVAK